MFQCQTLFRYPKKGQNKGLWADDKAFFLTLVNSSSWQLIIVAGTWILEGPLENFSLSICCSCKSILVVLSFSVHLIVIDS